MAKEIQHMDGFIKMITLSIQTNEAAEEEDWEKAIDLLKAALKHFSPEVEARKPGIRTKMLQTIGHYYMLIDKPREADTYFSEATNKPNGKPGNEGFTKTALTLLWQACKPIPLCRF